MGADVPINLVRYTTLIKIIAVWVSLGRVSLCYVRLDKQPFRALFRQLCFLCTPFNNQIITFTLQNNCKLANTLILLRIQIILNFRLRIILDWNVWSSLQLLSNSIKMSPHPTHSAGVCEECAPLESRSCATFTLLTVTYQYC